MSNSKVSQPMGTADLAAAGPIYQPPKVLTQDDFKQAAGMFISPDGHAARCLVQSKLNPFSVAAMSQVNSITDTARKARPNTALADAKISTAGISSGLRDTRDYYNQDLRFTVVANIIIVLLIFTALRNQPPRARQDTLCGPVIRRRSSERAAMDWVLARHRMDFPGGRRQQPPAHHDVPRGPIVRSRSAPR